MLNFVNTHLSNLYEMLNIKTFNQRQNLFFKGLTRPLKIYDYKMKLYIFLDIYRNLSLELFEINESLLLLIYMLSNERNSNCPTLFKVNGKNLFIEKMIVIVKIIANRKTNYSEIFVKNIKKIIQKSLFILCMGGSSTDARKKWTKNFSKFERRYKKNNNDQLNPVLNYKLMIDLLRTSKIKIEDFSDVLSNKIDIEFYKPLRETICSLETILKILKN